MGERRSEVDTTARLIEKAIRGLPAREQARVTRYLIRSWLDLRGTSQPPGPLYEALYRAPADVPIGGRVFLGPAWTAPVSVGSELQTLPVRLPEEQHTRLKEWCAEHGFSMASVIRGLVENFLNARGGHSSDAPD